MLPTFLRENSISVPEKKKTWSDCIWFLLNHMKGESFRNKVARKDHVKKASASSHPHSAPKDVTLLRAILTITHLEGRSVYVETNDKLDRSELDRRTGHLERWKQLLSIYGDTTRSELDSINIDLTAYGYNMDEPEDSDDITVETFSKVVQFMNHWYGGKARSAKNTSDQHLNFDSFVNGKGWLIFYHHKLEEISDTDIMNATCASLPPDVFAMSGDGGTETSDLSTPNKSTTSARSSGRSVSGRNSPKSAGLLNAKRIEAADAKVWKKAELESLTKL